jgi:hypothetical protein
MSRRPSLIWQLYLLYPDLLEILPIFHTLRGKSLTVAAGSKDER